MGDPFRSDLEAAHRRIEQLEEDLARTRMGAATGESEKRASRRMGIAILVGVAMGVVFMLGAVRSRSRALAECSLDLEQERSARAAAESLMARAVSTAPPPPLSIRSRLIDTTVQSTRARLVEDAIGQILEREPAPGELDAWLARAGDARSVRDAIAHSDEVVKRIQGIYTEAMRHPADANEIAAYTSQLTNGASMDRIRTAIMTAPGAKADCSTPYWFDAQGVKHYKPECIR